MVSLHTIGRYKNTVPFSNRLNVWLEEQITDLFMNGAFVGIDYTSEDGYDTYEAIKDYYDKHNKLIVWNGGSDTTIFGNRDTNLLFRAWHDYTHIVNGFDFSTEGEAMTAFAQAAQLPDKWLFERQLILCEVIGQVLYYEHHKDFPKDQRSFTIDYLISGDITTKQ